MYVSIDDEGNIDGRYEDENAKVVMEHGGDEIVLQKVPDDLADIGRGIYKYKVIDGAFVLKEDTGGFVEENKRAIINTYRARRDELLAQTDWTQVQDCPLDLHMRERYRAYRQFLRDFPVIYDPEINDNGEPLHDYTLPEDLEAFETGPEAKYGLNYTNFIGVCIQGINDLNIEFQTEKEKTVKLEQKVIELEGERYEQNKKIELLEMSHAALIRRLEALENM